MIKCYQKEKEIEYYAFMYMNLSHIEMILKDVNKRQNYSTFNLVKKDGDYFIVETVSEFLNQNEIVSNDCVGWFDVYENFNICSIENFVKKFEVVECLFR